MTQQLRSMLISLLVAFSSTIYSMEKVIEQPIPAQKLTIVSFEDLARMLKMDWRMDREPRWQQCINTVKHIDQKVIQYMHLQGISFEHNSFLIEEGKDKPEVISSVAIHALKLLSARLDVVALFDKDPTKAWFVTTDICSWIKDHECDLAVWLKEMDPMTSGDMLLNTLKEQSMMTIITSNQVGIGIPYSVARKIPYLQEALYVLEKDKNPQSLAMPLVTMR